MERDQMTFYRSFWEAIKRQKKDKDKLSALMAILSYGMDGEQIEMTNAAEGIFILSKPILDAAARKSAGGKRSRKDINKMPVTTAKDNNNKKEKEGEKEREKEDECPPPMPPSTGDPAVAAVMATYLDRINPGASQTSIDELKGYIEILGKDVCLRALDAALDEKKTNWSYIRGILRRCQAQGVRCLADWNRLEEKRDGSRSNAGASASPAKNWNIKSALDGD